MSASSRLPHTSVAVLMRLLVQAGTHGANCPGSDAPRPAGAPEAGVAVLAAERADVEAAAGYLAPRTDGGALRCRVAPTVQEISQVRLGERDQKIQAFPPQRADEPLAARVGLRA